MAKFSCDIHVYHRAVCCREFIRGLFLSLRSACACNDVDVSVSIGKEISLHILIGNNELARRRFYFCSRVSRNLSHTTLALPRLQAINAMVPVGGTLRDRELGQILG